MRPGLFPSAGGESKGADGGRLEEFVRTSYTEVSINKIIQIAGIPRGSFYQYFEGKEDLFFYLLDDVHRHFIQVFCKLLDRAGGDLFQMHLRGV